MGLNKIKSFFSAAKKLTEAKEKIEKLQRHIMNITPFAEVGVRASQEALRGYLWLDYKVHPDGPRRMSFNLALRAFEKTEGGQKEKLWAALQSLQDGVPCYFSDAIKKDRDGVMERLKKVTKVSLYTSPLEHFDDDTERKTP